LDLEAARLANPLLQIYSHLYLIGLVVLVLQTCVVSQRFELCVDLPFFADGEVCANGLVPASVFFEGAAPRSLTTADPFSDINLAEYRPLLL
jgi:hypothetical protein